MDGQESVTKGPRRFAYWPGSGEFRICSGDFAVQNEKIGQDLVVQKANEKEGEEN